MTQPINLSRRAVLAGTGALVLGVQLPLLPGSAAAAGTGAGTGVPIDAWLKISPEAVTVVVARSEMGQGVFTTLPTLVAEELDVDWRVVRAEMAPLDARYGNPLLGNDMRTGDSTSLRAAFLPLRRAGAAARQMLLAAAARIWRVPVTELLTESGVVKHPASDRQASYGALARLAVHQPVPPDPPLCDPARFRLIGRSLPRLDTPAKVVGQASFGIDVRLPDLLYAAIRHCPVPGGSLAKFDASALKTAAGLRPGLAAAVPLKSAMAVVADTWWQAHTALAEIVVSWAEGDNAELASATLDPALVQALDPKDPRAVAVAVDQGGVDSVIAGATRVVEAVYRLPYLPHAPLEPMNATASVTPTDCELWLPTQDQGQYARVLPPLLGIKADRIKVNTTFLGGSFGRRLDCDFGVEAALLSRAVGRPVQLIWTREEDIRRDFYRPASVSRVSVALDARGRVTGWRHRVAAPSILSRVRPAALKNGLDATAIEGIEDQPYALPALRVDYVRQDTGVPVGVWRSGGHSGNAFVVESMIDEVAAANAQDPYQLRRTLLANAPRARAVLDLVAERAGWNQPLAARPAVRRGRGIALHQAYGSIAAIVAEVTVTADGRLRVDRVVGALDCGLVVNPDLVMAQMEGAILFGLSAALHGKITFEKGRVVQSNFHDVKVLSLAEAPPVTVHLIPSQETPGGAGEIGLPPLAPALTNAIFSACRRRLRSLPVDEHELDSE